MMRANNFHDIVLFAMKKGTQKLNLFKGNDTRECEKLFSHASISRTIINKCITTWFCIFPAALFM